MAGGITVRELITKFGFQVDTAKLDKLEQGLAETKVVATATAEAVAGLATQVREMAARALPAVEALGEVATAAKGVATSMAAAGEAAVLAGAEMRTSLVGVGSEVTAVETKVVGLQGMFGKLGHAAKGFMLTMGATMGLYESVEAGEHYAEYQQNMQKTGAAMMASPEEIEAMKKKALQISGQTGFNPRQVSEGMIELGSKGFDAESTMKMAPTSLKLARAGMVDPKLATELLTTTLEGFYGRDASKSEHVGNVIARVHDVGGINMPSLLESMKYVAPAGRAMGQSLEDVGTMTAVLGRFGIHGSMAGNAIKSMIVKLAAPTSMGQRKLADAGMANEVTGEKGKHNKAIHESMVKAMGLKTTDAKGDMLPITEIFRQLVAKTSKMGNKQRATILKDMFGLEDIPQAMALMTAMSEKGGAAFDEVSRKIHNTDGALERMNAIMQKGLMPAWQRMMAKAEVFADLMLEKMAPGIEWFFDAIGNGVEALGRFLAWFDDMSHKVPLVAGILAGLRAALLLIGGIAVVGAIRAVATAFTGKLIPAILDATVASWKFLAANFEWALVAAAILGVILVIQSFIVWANGGKSALAPWFDMWYNFGAWLRDVFPTIIDATVSKFQKMIDAVAQIFALANGTVKQDAVPGKQVLPKAATTSSIAAGLAGGHHALAHVQPGRAAGGNSTVIHAPATTTVTVNMPANATPAQTGHTLAGYIEEAHRRSLAEAAAKLPYQAR